MKKKESSLDLKPDNRVFNKKQSRYAPATWPDSSGITGRNGVESVAGFPLGSLAGFSGIWSVPITWYQR